MVAIKPNIGCASFPTPINSFVCSSHNSLIGKGCATWKRVCAVQSKLYHAGIRGRVSRSTVADANETRDWRICADFAQVLVGRARQLYAGMDPCGSIPCLIRITPANLHNVSTVDELLFQPGDFYVMDRNYIDFARPYAFTRSLDFLVVRAKSSPHYCRRAYRHVDKSTGLRSDHRIFLQGPKTSQAYSDTLRHISYVDTDIHKCLVFSIHNSSPPALTIAHQYKCRWHVELFLKWTKQNLRIKAFFGTSKNAVNSQIRIAITVFPLVAILKKELKIDRSLGEILQIPSITHFDKASMNQILKGFPLQQKGSQSCEQLILFEF